MKRRIVLASASPRRIEILSAHGIAAEVIPADVDESLPEGTPAYLACTYNALNKGLYIEKKLMDSDPENSRGTVIIAADTIVYNGKILGKPANDEDAFATLRELSGKTHQVMTGVTVIDAGRDDRRVFCERTMVTFDAYGDEDIKAYIATGEPADKAGSYAIQGAWGSHVTGVDGDFDNVIGLPWNRLQSMLSDMGVTTDS